MPRDTDKPKKSWREIDQGKDRSSHRKADAPSTSPFKQARAEAASKVYKSKLDAFFDGDAPPPAHIKEKLEALGTSEGGKERKEAIQKIIDARGGAEKTLAVKGYLSRFELPPDFDVLVEVLACSDEDYVLQALDEMAGMLSANRAPKRSAVLEQRLKILISNSEEPIVVEKAKAVMTQLRLFKQT